MIPIVIIITSDNEAVCDEEQTKERWEQNFFICHLTDLTLHILLNQ